MNPDFMPLRRTPSRRSHLERLGAGARTTRDVDIIFRGDRAVP